MPLGSLKFTPLGLYLNFTLMPMRFVFQSPMLLVACHEIMQTFSGGPPRVSWCSAVLKSATSVVSESTFVTRCCQSSFSLTVGATRRMRAWSAGPRRPFRFSRRPTSLLPVQPPPQAGTLMTSSGSLKFFAVVTARAPVRPSLARRFVSGVGSQMQPRVSQTSCSPQASTGLPLKHDAPCQKHRTPPAAAGCSAEAPQGSPAPSPLSSRKPPRLSFWRRLRALLVCWEETQDSRDASICCLLQDLVPPSAPPAHAASMLLRTFTPSCAGAWP
mmetsp:Transcript_118309/g.381903  ORF Transcript_118309/g.381903 Transcript_118309/m.381903 type:complete len:272 (-) Transcript_118309:284-1099(-)